MNVGARVFDAQGREGIVIALAEAAESTSVAHVEYVAASSEQAHTAWIPRALLVEKT